MRLSSIWLDLCSPRPKTAPGAKCSISLHDLWRRTGCTTQRVQTGSARARRSLSTGVVWKQHCPAMGSHRKDCRAYHVWLCPGGQGRAPSVSPCPQWMAEVSPSWRGLGECSWSAEDLLFTKICLSPEWLPLCSASVITSRRKHWAPKRFQAVNSRIVLTRARPNIWEQIAATPRSCLHQQPAHEAAPRYFI